MSERTIEYSWVSSQEALQSIMSSWQAASFLALDTEFERTNTFYAKPGLIQIADGKNVYLIDPLVVTDLRPLAAILEDPAITIVMHSMSEDVDLLSYCCDCEIRSIFDTQIAASFLGYGMSLGFQNLVREVLGLELDKSETRSDWLRRPLSEQQLNYAAADAFYLVKLYETLNPALIDAGWHDAALEECDGQVRAILDSKLNTESAYLKLRGGWDLTPDKQAGLKQLVIWRDETAKLDNVPKSWVFGDAQLIQFAVRAPRSIEELKRVEKIRPKSVRIYGDVLLSQLELAVKASESFELIDGPIRGRELDSYRAVKKLLASIASKKGLEPQLLAARKMLEAIIIHVVRKGNASLPSDLADWRKQLFGEQLLKSLQG